MGRIERRNRSPLWPRGVTGRGTFGISKGEGWKGRKLKGLKEERDKKELVLCTQTVIVSLPQTQTDSFPFSHVFLFLSLPSLYF